MKQLRHHSGVLFVAFLRLLVKPQFIILSAIGNIVVVVFAGLFYLCEHEANPLVDEKMDAIWWAFTTITTVGFGDIVPATLYGRIIGIALMLLGTAIFACYVALITDAFLAAEFAERSMGKSQKMRRPGAREYLR